MFSSQSNGTFLMRVALALLVAFSLSACQQSSRLGPNPSIDLGNNQDTFVPTDEPAPVITPEESPTADPVLLYTNSNTGPVKVGATAPATFTVESGSVRIVQVVTYHYVEPKGLASTGDVHITGSSGKLYGLWTTDGYAGQDGVKNASWVARTDVVLPAGTYTIDDSEPSTWSSNANTGGAGMFWIYGYQL
jgi:hypothetical protein